MFFLAVFIPTSILKSSGANESPFLSTVSAVFTEKSDNQLVFIGPNPQALQSPDLYVVQEASLKGVSVPTNFSSQVLGQIIGEADSGTGRDIIEYIVQTGDTPDSIAAKHNISLNTLLWANGLNTSSKIKIGQKLTILPVSGVVYNVKSGDTLSEIARLYKGSVAEIIGFNDLSGEGDIFVGDILIIPGGTMPVSKPKYTEVPLANSYFIFPTQGRLTQGLHWYNAIDIANECGSPIFAAAQGQVLRVKYGYNFGAGNYLTILHPNGIVTSYGHISTSLVNPGNQVSQGQIIAYVGGKPGTPGAGISTGCHLHFGVQGARNPFTP